MVSGLPVLRVLRIARVVKLARVIRLMSFFRELGQMIWGILGCLKPLLWVTLILATTFYMFSITFLYGMTANLSAGLWINPDTQGLRENFGTIDSGILSLYMAVSNGRSWGEYYRDLQALPPQYSILFLVYVSLTVFGVLNIVTGVFVDTAMQANHQCRQMVIREELAAKKRLLNELNDLFVEMDENGDGLVTQEEFDTHMLNEQVVAYFKSLNLEISDTKMLFQLIDTDNSGQISIMEFLSGCYELQGEARSIDAKIMRMQLSKLLHNSEQMLGRIDVAAI